MRLHNMRSYLHCRDGDTLPDDDAGENDLRELLLPISVGPNADLKMRKAIEICAPWMAGGKAEQLVEDINRTPIWHRKPTERVLGQRLRVTHQEWLHWRLWTITPYDWTDEQLAEWRKERDRERKRKKRLARGGQTRAQYLASFAKTKKPWV